MLKSCVISAWSMTTTAITTIPKVAHAACWPLATKSRRRARPPYADAHTAYADAASASKTARFPISIICSGLLLGRVLRRAARQYGVGLEDLGLGGVAFDDDVTSFGEHVGQQARVPD